MYIQSGNSVIDGEDIKPLESEAPLIIYIDFKSPYAYLSVAPTREMLSKLNVIADWRPFVLDIPSYLGSAKLDEGGKRVAKQNRTEEQWSGVKYAYFDCRRYANLSGLTVRGTIKIWNTDLPSIGMLWVKRLSNLIDQCQDGSLLERYIDSIYDPFWKRELDVEDPTAILDILEGIGAPTEGFLDYIKGKGFSLNKKLQKSAFDAGVYGVPTYILSKESVNGPKYEKFFGREHLPRITWLLSGRNGEAPVTAYNLPRLLDKQILAKSAVNQLKETRLTPDTSELITFFDFNSAHSYVALESIKAVKKEGISINWKPFVSKPLKAPAKESPKEDRGTKHRRIRCEYIADDIQRYAPHHLNDIYSERDCKFADMGLLWLQKKLKAGNDVVDSYVTKVFHHLWKDLGSITTANDIEGIIIEQGLSIEGWKEYSEGLGLQHLKEVRKEIESQAINITPVFYIGAEPFQGLSHLPLVISRLKSGI